MSKLKNILRRLGPGLITASVVLGPGSIVAASGAGAEMGYGLLWVIVLAGIFMATYTAMGARLGCALEETPLTYIARRRGRWLSVLTGLSAFFVCAGFQFGNNLGIADAANTVCGLSPEYKPLWAILFTSTSLLFIFFARSLYRHLEHVMMVLVAIMIFAFVGNLFWTGIKIPDLVVGLVPRPDRLDLPTLMIASAWMGTTFSIVAAFYQPYLVRAKGWTRDNVQAAIKDAWIGIAVLVCLSAVIMCGAAATLHGSDVEFTNIGQLAQQLKVLGPAANVVFGLGLAAAAFSSLIVNAMVGGNLLADGLGLNSEVNGKATKLIASVVLVIGCAVAVALLRTGIGSKTSLLLAQSSTLLAAPLSGILLLVMASNKKIMGDLTNGAGSVIVGVIGLAVILALVFRTLHGLIPKFVEIWENTVASGTAL